MVGLLRLGAVSRVGRCRQRRCARRITAQRRVQHDPLIEARAAVGDEVRLGSFGAVADCKEIQQTLRAFLVF